MGPEAPEWPPIIDAPCLPRDRLCGLPWPSRSGPGQGSPEALLSVHLPLPCPLLRLSWPASSSRSFPLLGALSSVCLMWPVTAHSSCLSLHVNFLRAAFSGHPILSKSPDLGSDSALVCFLQGSRK